MFAKICLASPLSWPCITNRKSTWRSKRRPARTSQHEKQSCWLVQTLRIACEPAGRSELHGWAKRKVKRGVRRIVTGEENQERTRWFDPKSKSGRREIPTSAQLVVTLREWKEKRPKSRL